MMLLREAARYDLLHDPSVDLNEAHCAKLNEIVRGQTPSTELG
jgi:hypothetical protein